jgi:hypothetical protein
MQGSTYLPIYLSTYRPPTYLANPYVLYTMMVLLRPVLLNERYIDQPGKAIF